MHPPASQCTLHPCTVNTEPFTFVHCIIQSVPPIVVYIPLLSHSAKLRWRVQKHLKRTVFVRLGIKCSRNTQLRLVLQWIALYFAGECSWMHCHHLGFLHRVCGWFTSLYCCKCLNSWDLKDQVLHFKWKSIDQTDCHDWRVFSCCLSVLPIFCDLY